MARTLVNDVVIAVLRRFAAEKENRRIAPADLALKRQALFLCRFAAGRTLKSYDATPLAEKP